MGIRDKYGVKYGELEQVCLAGKHILLLTETWTTEESPPPDLPGYEVIQIPGSRQRVGRASGGLALYVSEQISHLVSACRSRSSKETLWVKVEASIGLSRDLYIGLCYFPPQYSAGCRSGSSSNPFYPLDSDIEYFSALGHIMLAGDFNARTAELRDCHDDNQLRQHLNIPAIINSQLPDRQNEDKVVNGYGRHLVDLALTHSLAICNGRTKGDEKGSFTHRAFHTGASGEGGSSLVDYYLLDCDFFHERVKSLEVGGAYPVSDHFPIDLHVNLREEEVPVHTAHVGTDTLKLTEEGFSAFREIIADPTLRNAVVSEAFQESTSSHATNMFTTYIKEAAACCFSKKAPHKINSYKSKLWYDGECKLLRSRYRTLMKDNGLSCQIRDLRREYKIVTRRKRRNYEDQQGHAFVSQVVEQPAKFWKRFRRGQPCNKIKSREVWFQYYKDLYSETELVTPSEHMTTQSGMNDSGLEDFYKVRGDLRGILLGETSKSLNVGITEEEVDVALKMLRRNKAVGLDDIQGDLLIEGKRTLTEPLTMLFNNIFKGHFPDSWKIGVITPIYKKGDALDCGNYRGVTVSSTLAKLYTSVLNLRLTEWAEKWGCRAVAQAGFRKDHRCSDNVFILRALIEKANASKGSLYICFVDFSKAFDTIPRKLLWERLRELRVHGNMMETIQSMYQNVRACVKTPEGLTATFPSEMGVKQGCPLSPTLFGLFLDPLEELLLQGNVDAPFIGDQAVPAQFFADDSQLISTSPQGLQRALGILQSFCNTHGLLVNVDKTRIMQIGEHREFPWTYNSEAIAGVQEYKNLGMTVRSTGHFAQGCADSLTTSGARAMHALLSRCSGLHIHSPQLMLRLFDSLVRPVLSYGCEVWGLDYGMQVHGHLVELRAGTETRRKVKPDGQELLHKKFVKRVLGVCDSTPDIIIMGEVGRLPLAFFRLRQIVRYWNRLCALPDHRLLKKAFLDSATLAENSKSWVSIFKTQLQSLGIPWEGLQPVDTNCIRELEVEYVEAWKLRLSIQSIKTQTYSRLTILDYKMQDYLRFMKCKTRRNLFARFRTGSHWLQVQVGRFQGIARGNRVCEQCCSQEVEDEEHFLINCSHYEDIRARYASLFTTGLTVSLEEFFQKDQALIAKFVEECYEIHGGSSVV